MEVFDIARKHQICNCSSTISHTTNVRLVAEHLKNDIAKTGGVTEALK
jgi:hypothetical protein